MSAAGETRSAAEIYDAFATKYRAYSETRAAYIAAIDQLVIDRLAGHADRLIDYGAGDGVRGAALQARLKPEVFVQTDISPEMVARCRALGAADRVSLVSEPGWAVDVPPADAAMCLWNVLGHVPDTEARIEVLRQIWSLLRPGGMLCIDVNNRHYVGYGRWVSLGRQILDALRPDYSRGDVRFTWGIDGVDYPASGHFFTPAEMRDLLGRAGFEIVDLKAVDYRTGVVSASPVAGQLFFVARRPADGGGSA